MNDCIEITESSGSGILHLSFVMILLFLIGFDFWVTLWQIKSTELEMQRDLLKKTRLVAQTIDIHRLKSLSGTMADITSPSYLELKEQLAVIKNINPMCRFVYIMGRLPDGRVFFFVDNEPVGSKDESPAGQIYAEVSPDYLRAFDQKAECVTKPVTDRWGRWVTALVPITDPGSGELLGVLGMDADARNWRKSIYLAAIPGALLCLLLIVILIVGKLLLIKRSHAHHPLPGWMRYWEVILTIAVGLTVTLFAAWLTHETERRARGESFRSIAESNTVSLLKIFRSIQDIELESLAIFYQESENVTLDEFDQFVQFLNRNPAVQAWEWIPVVPAHEKARFERSARTDGAPAFTIWQMDAAGERIPAFGRKEYYPVFRVYPITGNKSALGYDLGSETVRRAALERAIRTGLVSGTDPVRFVQERGHAKSMLIYRPVYGKRQPGQLRGVALAVLRLGTALKSANPNALVVIELFLLHRNGRMESLGVSDDDFTRKTSGLSVSRPILAFGKAFLASASAAPEFEKNYPVRAGGITVLVGLMITAALGVVIGTAFYRRGNLESLVLERTKSLRDSEEALTQSLNRLSLAADSAGFGVWDFNFVQNQMTWDDWMFRIYGVAQQDFDETYEAWQQTLHPADVKRVQAEIEQALSGRNVFNTEFRIVHPEKGVRTIKANARLVKNDNGRPIRMTGICYDITESRAANQKLLDERQRLANVIYGTNIGTWEWNIQTGETIFNEKWAQNVGYELRELMPVNIETWQKMVHPEDALKSADLLKRHFIGETPYYSCQCRMKHKDGHWVWVQERGRVITYQKDGKPLMMFGTHLDITDVKRAEEELLDINRQLEEATSTANEMAIQAEAANRAKSEFLANMSHEIRTPLNGVIGMTLLLLETELTTMQRGYAEIVHASSEALLRLINDILDFSKLEAKKMDFVIRAFNLREFLEDWAVMLAPQAHSKNLAFHCVLEPDVPVFLCGDSGRLRQILTNLAGNAIKFTKQGDVIVRVVLESEDNEMAKLHVSIRDTGIGIPQNKIGLLFKKFTQLDTSGTRKFGGTGLGLAISKQLVEMMGGEIGVTSDFGKGATFWFTIRMPKQTMASVVEENVAPDLEGVRVLVVDNHPVSREIMETYLTAWQMRLTAVQDGTEAIRFLNTSLIDEDPFQIVMIEKTIPAINGMTLGETIRKDDRFASLRMVFLSAIGVKDDENSLYRTIFDANLTKPFRTSELRDMLLRILHEPYDAAKRHVTHALQSTIGANYDLFNDQNLRILLVEDNYTNQQVAIGILSKFGCSVDLATNGSDALKAVENNIYHLIFMDIQMPVMDGIEATRHIRSKQYDIPIIAMTANAMSGDREACLAAGMDDYITKPVAPQIFEDVLKKWLPYYAAGDSNATHEPGRMRVNATEPAQATVWDREGLLNRLIGDSTLAKTVISGFLMDMPGQIETIGRHIDTSDISGVLMQAHKIKGAAANVGGEALKETAFEIEEAARRDDVSFVKRKFELLETRFDSLRQAMRAYLDDES